VTESERERARTREREERIGERGGIIGVSISPWKGNDGGVHLLGEDRRPLRGHAGASHLEEDDGERSWAGPCWASAGRERERVGPETAQFRLETLFLWNLF
jgi:hypothetical protein